MLAATLSGDSITGDFRLRLLISDFFWMDIKFGILLSFGFLDRSSDAHALPYCDWRAKLRDEWIFAIFPGFCAICASAATVRWRFVAALD
jgi:hypothetical protein